jgi:hypothetical protein
MQLHCTWHAGLFSSPDECVMMLATLVAVRLLHAKGRDGMVGLHVARIAQVRCRADMPMKRK